jgi:regulator of cell morphogenesis and NO signaling
VTYVLPVTIGDLVADNPAAARVFERFGLDYCCHGERTLVDACAEARVDPVEVEGALAGITQTDDRSWTGLDLAALAELIVSTHHRYLHDELPVLDALADKVLAVHGERHPELVEVRRLVEAVRADLEPHLQKEERVLFPAIRAAAAGTRDFPFGSIENPIRMMTMEHEQTGELLAELRAVTSGYRLPADACASFRSLYERLDALELDTHLHIHKENHVLFPAAVALLAA